MEVDTVCISVERHLELISGYEESIKSKKHSTTISGRMRFYNYRMEFNDLNIQTDSESVDIISKELKSMSCAMEELELKNKELEDMAEKLKLVIEMRDVEIERIEMAKRSSKWFSFL